MIAKGLPSITIEDIHKKCSDFDIASKYLGIHCVPELIISPIRDDRKPSLSIYESQNYPGTLRYNDFGNGDSGTLYKLLGKIWGLSYTDVLQKILNELPKNIDINKKKNKIKIYKKTGGKIEVKIREWREYDLTYWDSYGISLPWLKFGDVYPISHIIITKGDITHAIPAEKYAYVYVERKDGKVSLKIYQPYSTEFKWMSKHDSSVWDLWTKIPEKGDNLIITSSRKDALCVWSNTGIPSLSLQGEGYIPKEHVIQQLKDRFKRIFVLYDNDFQSEENHGRMYGKNIADMFGLIQIEIPEEYKSKDPSDLVKNHGRKVLKEIISKLIN